MYHCKYVKYVSIQYVKYVSLSIFIIIITKLFQTAFRSNQTVLKEVYLEQYIKLQLN